MADDNANEPTTDPAKDQGDQGEAPDASSAPAKKAVKKAPAKKAAAKKAPAKKAAAKKTASSAEDAPTKKSTSKKATSSPDAADPAPADSGSAAGSTEPAEGVPATAVLFQAPEPNPPRARSRRRPTAVTVVPGPSDVEPTGETTDNSPAGGSGEDQPEKPKKQAAKRQTPKKQTPKNQAAKLESEDASEETSAATSDLEPKDRSDAEDVADDDESDSSGEGGDGAPRRRRRRGGRRRRKGGGGNGDGAQGGWSSDEDSADDRDNTNASGARGNNGDDHDGEDGDGDGTSRRRRRRRREGDNGGGPGDDPQNTVTRVRRPRSAEDEITAVAGSTRLEAKKQRRREGREAGRRRAPIVSEAEFLARREAVERVMVIRQRGDLTQIGVLEDKVLVEHYVARESQASMIGNVYLGRVQNVLPSMEAAFIDIGKGRNAVLYAGEVNWSALGHKDGAPRKIESVLTSGQPVLVQVTKDPVGHKGARLTSQISMAGRFLVYVPDGTTSGISRKLPDNERNRLKTLLKEIVPDTAGVIVRTAAEGASEDELTRDVERLKARWEDVETKAKGKAPQLLYGEPDLTLKVVRDLFTEDFAKLAIQGDDAWTTVEGYVSQVAPDLADRLDKFEDDTDIFAAYRVDEQIAKALDRKVWLPSGGSLVIDRTEAMTVIDVNTGKFTGSGGNLEETVTKNNLEAAEEVVRQLRLRDIGGIIVVDYIDMVLESNRDLVLRRMVECLGRDRTRHQVAEVTSLGLVQMTRKRIGVGLVESFSHNCEACAGRGVVIEDAPVEPKNVEDDRGRSNRRRGSGSGSGGTSGGQGGGRGGRGQDASPTPKKSAAPSPRDVAAMAKPPSGEDQGSIDLDADEVKTAASIDPDTDTPVAPTAEILEPSEIEATTGSVESTEPAAPAVTTRSRSRRSASRPAAAPVDTAVPAESVETPSPVPESPAAQDIPDAGPSDAGPSESTAPQVVTRSRSRRSASRPAGTPAPAPAPIVVSSDPVEAAPVAEPVNVPEPPKVVTRTRGRTATRAAGPPEPAAAEGGGPEA